MLRSALFLHLSSAVKSHASRMTARQLAMCLHAISLGDPSVVRTGSMHVLIRFLFHRDRFHTLPNSYLRLILSALSRRP
ncbi:hypothetical protein CSUI_010756, partial [Cystoisospora suis]